MANCGCPQRRAKEVYVIYLLRARVREKRTLQQSDRVPQTRKGRALELGQLAVSSCFSKMGDEVGLGQAGKTSQGLDIPPILDPKDKGS